MTVLSDGEMAVMEQGVILILAPHPDGYIPNEGDVVNILAKSFLLGDVLGVDWVKLVTMSLWSALRAGQKLADEAQREQEID